MKGLLLTMPTDIIAVSAEVIEFFVFLFFYFSDERFINKYFNENFIGEF